MAYMKINTDDLILDKKIVSDNTYRYIYTMVCRADINKTNRWNMIPSTEMAVFNKAAPEWDVICRVLTKRNAISYKSIL